METIAKYVYQVYLKKSFSEAAKALFVSQPSLSAAVASKEKELGFRIFDRSTKPISLTREGEIYIEMLDEIIQSENSMRHRLRLLEKKSAGSIAIGTSCYTSYYLVPTICGAFYRRYPSIEVKLDLGNKGTGVPLWDKLDEKKLDVIFTYTFDKQKYTGIPIFEERMVAAMHKSLVTPALIPYALSRKELLSGGYPAEKERLDVALFHDIPFFAFSKAASTGQYMADMLGYYSAASHDVLNARHSGVHFNMMCAGLGAILTSDASVKVANEAAEDVLYFAFPREISTRALYAVLRKNDVTEKPVEQFLEVAREVAASENALSLYYE